MKKALLCSFATLLPLVGNAEDIHKDNEFQDPDYETPGYVITPKATTALMQEMQPTMKFGGYIMGKYSVKDKPQTEASISASSASMPMATSTRISIINSSSK